LLRKELEAFDVGLEEAERVVGVRHVREDLVFHKDRRGHVEAGRLRGGRRSDGEGACEREGEGTHV
jgi:hypothetical protein